MKNPTLLKECYIIAEEMKCPTILIPFGKKLWWWLLIGMLLTYLHI